MGKIQIKRIYDSASPDDGVRILIDRLWPRGISKEEARIDFWLKEVAPSDELRKWFNHDPEKWGEFKIRYQQELTANPSAVKELKSRASSQDQTTLLYAAKDTQHNNAVAIQEFIEKGAM